jgi:hypothetical protein
MTAFLRRFRDTPSLEELTAIETLALVDRTPRMPVVGVGTGTLLLVGEFEDGAFADPTEVYGANDEATKFGAFGYTYGTTEHQNPCARLHNAEAWNGNGWLKGQNLRPKRKIICRVNTSCGTVRFSLAAGKRTLRGPWAMVAGDQLSVTTDTGGPVNMTAIAATRATNGGAGFPAGLVNGDQIGIAVDGLPEVIVTFQASDTTRALVCARINGFLGYTAAVDDGANVDLFGAQYGTGGRLTTRDITAGVLAKIGQVAGTFNGGGNVANLAAVTPTELAALINIAGIIAINGAAMVDPNTNELVIYRSGSSSGTLRVDNVVGTPCTTLVITTGASGVVTGNVGVGFTVPAGTRVRNAGGEEWVTMRTLTWPEGTVAAPNVASQDVEIRANNELVAHSAAVGGTVTTEVDLPTTRMVEVTNPSNLTASPLTEAAIDAAYKTALDATLNPRKASAQATELVIARHSTVTNLHGRQNAIDASNEGLYGRHFYARPAIGATSAQAIADVALYRYDRVFYAWPGWRMYVPEIAKVGAAGGVGFSDDGLVNIGGDGPLAYLHSVLNPEENIGQDTGRLTFVSDIDSTVTETMNRAMYTALKAAGICAPRIDTEGKPCYQSEVTADLTPGRTTQKRRCFADYVQDSGAKILMPYSKKLATDDRRAGAIAAIDGWLKGLKSENDPSRSRIVDYAVTDQSLENPDAFAQGVVWFKVQVQQWPSMDSIVFDTEVGEGVVVVHE